MIIHRTGDYVSLFLSIKKEGIKSLLEPSQPSLQLSLQGVPLLKGLFEGSSIISLKNDGVDRK